MASKQKLGLEWQPLPLPDSTLRPKAEEVFFSRSTTRFILKNHWLTTAAAWWRPGTMADALNEPWAAWVCGVATIMVPAPFQAGLQAGRRGKTTDSHTSSTDLRVAMLAVVI